MISCCQSLSHSVIDVFWISSQSSVSSDSSKSSDFSDSSKSSDSSNQGNPVIPESQVIPVIPVIQVIPVIPVSQVIPVSPLSPVSLVRSVSPVRLAHLWVDFRVIIILRLPWCPIPPSPITITTHPQEKWTNHSPLVWKNYVLKTEYNSNP